MNTDLRSREADARSRHAGARSRDTDSRSGRRSGKPSAGPWVWLVVALAACAGGTGDAAEGAGGYDLVLAGGRVIDPESGLDAVRHVGVRDGRIAAVSETPLEGARTIDAEGLVVAPGFIDLHEHGQNEESYALMVRDGVTAAFELEVGTEDVSAWYAAREGGQLVNYGVSIGHIQVRMDVLGDPSESLLPSGVGGSGTATPEQLDEIERRIREGLEEGAVAVGFGTAYTPGADMAEIERMMRVAAEHGASAHIHVRGGLAGLDSTLAAARRAGAGLHIVHVNSSAGRRLDGFLAAIQAARDAGQDVTTETYPYAAGMTEIQSALFDDWASWPDERFARYQLVSTGERLTRTGFAEARERGGTVISHSRTEEQTRAAVASPLTMIASDGFIEDGRGHPRTSGSYSKVLGRYVREQGLLTLEEALAKMTIRPARRLEGRVPAMTNKGRIRVGADADVTVFDPARVINRSTYRDATIPAEGIPYVIVGGVVVVDGGQVTDARPGRAIRAVDARDLAGAGVAASWPPVATFSILGYDPETGEVGGAVQSRVFSVGNGVLWAEANVGVVATQAIVDVSYGPQGLELLRQGHSPDEVVDMLLANDPDPRPERWSKLGRQFSVMDAVGNVATHTGPSASEWAGHRIGTHVSAQGNILAGPEVVDGMVRAFEETDGHLSFRLLAALEAGQAAGGDRRGMQSAAMIIVQEDGGVWLNNDVVLRLQVDDSERPIAELRRLVEIAARQRERIGGG